MSQKWKQICSALTEAESQTRAGRLPGLASSTTGHPLTEHSLGSQAGPRAGHRPHYLRAGTCFQSPCLDFPDLSSPLSDLPLLTYFPPPHTHFSYSLSPFISVQKQIIQAKCVSWLLEKVLCSMNCVMVTLRVVVGGGGVMGRITHRRAEISGNSAGGCQDWATGQ